MKKNIKESQKGKDRLTFFDYALEIVGWLQIVASPLVAGLIIGAIIYFSNPSKGRLVLAIGVGLIGLIVGIVFATRVWKKQGTIHFVSRVAATPELDNLNDVKEYDSKTL